MSDLRYLRHKRAKGKSYYYFDTGQKDERGRPILTRLPDKRSLDFGGAYARAVAARTTRSRKFGTLDLDSLIRKYQLSPEYAKLADNSRTLYAHYLNVANKLSRGAKGESPPAAGLEPRDVLAIRDALAATPSAANATVKVIGSLYAWAVMPAHGYAKINPANGVTMFDQGEHKPWPESLLEEALADPSVQLEVALLYFTGQRIGDAIVTPKSAIKGGEIKVYAQKTKSWLTIPLAADLAKILAAQPRTDTVNILTNANTGQPWSKDSLRRKLQAWAAARGHEVVPHGLRKNAVIALLEAGCSEAEVASITDHSLAMVIHYGKERNQTRIARGAILKFDATRKARTDRESENLVKTGSENG